MPLRKYSQETWYIISEIELSKSLLLPSAREDSLAGEKKSSLVAVGGFAVGALAIDAIGEAGGLVAVVGVRLVRDLVQRGTSSRMGMALDSMHSIFRAIRVLSLVFSFLRSFWEIQK